MPPTDPTRDRAAEAMARELDAVEDLIADWETRDGDGGAAILTQVSDDLARRLEMRMALRNRIATLLTTVRTQAQREERERCALLVYQHAERLKHTSHRDGMGFGWQAGEDLCIELAAALRARPTDGAIEEGR